MKKFNFKLETVMSFKNQVLEEKRIEHATAVRNVATQENVISEMCRKADSINAEFNERKARGITVIEASKYSSFLRKLETDILGEYDVLYRLKAVEEEKREAVVEMKIETSTLEMLKKQKLAEYDKLIQKSNELFVEEFVSRQRVVNMMH